jgi:hypothetical protein
MIKHRFRNAIKQVKTYPGADINTDHNPVVCKMKLKLKKIKNGQQRTQLNMDLLRKSEMKIRYAVEVQNKFEELNVQYGEQATEDMEHKWSMMKESMQKSSRKDTTKEGKKGKDVLDER